MVQTDVWCSSAAVSHDDVLIQTGGYHAGDHKISTFTPCIDDGCDWIKLEENLGVTRWYSSNQILPDGRVIIVGGRGQFSYEFFPKNGNDSEVFLMSFLKETMDVEEDNNLYPFLHLLPDGNLFLFANQRSVMFDYMKIVILREFPMIPGEKRNYPAIGSSVMLPLKLAGVGGRLVVEVVVCGGAKGGAYMAALNGVYMAGSKSCGRLKVTDPRDYSKRGGWDSAVDPVLHPVLYKPGVTDPDKRFTILNPTTRSRMYHSAAILLPDGRILVDGHNPHKTYNFTGVRYPTDLSFEVFMPPYMDSGYGHLRPSINSIQGSGATNIVSYGQRFSIIFELPSSQTSDMGGLMVSMVTPSFTTHSVAMNQRLLELEIVNVQLLGVARKVTISAPPTINIAPPGYYMLFVVHEGVPGQAVWIKMIKP
ncbi:hypothetical protein LIER_27343 [Lithospermum erythrorhizon]|uniref:Galactose oxidase n=1 Tax=Lithospermum erythrorhizon TaxID=34254 RepID=A0AAV3REZ9_LITER